MNANSAATFSNKIVNKRTSKLDILKREWSNNKYLYIMLLPIIIYYIVFNYVPMYGIIIAFQDYMTNKGILGSHWVGLQWFKDFFTGVYFIRTLRNTLLLSLYDVLFAFSAPIIFALLLNEVKNKYYKSTVQTITYLPHFISVVVIGGMIVNFTSSNGLINNIIAMFGFERIQFLTQPEWFRPIYVISHIWQRVGWDSIIFLAALTNVDSQLYESSKLDGAGRWKQLIYITIPGIIPTIVIMLVLRMGSIMGSDFQKIIMIYNPAIYDSADVISTYIYRSGITQGQFSFATAVGLFNSVVNMFMLVTVNLISKKLTESSLW